MMGAKWAYESLTFGGYWAWDPVENASLVPWLILVAGIHTQIIFNATGHSLRPTFFFYIAAFILILYSTYLTRSGDLQVPFADLTFQGRRGEYRFEVSNAPPGACKPGAGSCWRCRGSLPSCSNQHFRVVRHGFNRVNPGQQRESGDSFSNGAAAATPSPTPAGRRDSVMFSLLPGDLDG